MVFIAYLMSFLCLLLNISLFVRLKSPNNFYLVFFQIGVVVLSPILIILALFGAGLSWLSQAPIAVAGGLLSTAISVLYIVLITRSQPDFEQAFGKDLETRIPLLLLPVFW